MNATIVYQCFDVIHHNQTLPFHGWNQTTRPQDVGDGFIILILLVTMIAVGFSRGKNEKYKNSSQRLP